MSLIAIAAGAAGAWGLSYGLSRFGREPSQPPQLYEYFLDNYWFKSARDQQVLAKDDQFNSLFKL